MNKRWTSYIRAHKRFPSIKKKNYNNNDKKINQRFKLRSKKNIYLSKIINKTLVIFNYFLSCIVHTGVQ